jgi:glycosyltransferase involved in cell wall biosynthesis
MLPVASGVAVYTERVLDELDADLFDVDVYAESVPIGKWPPPVKARRLFPAAALGVNSNPFDYDAIVYTIGTSRVHIETLERARRFPGIVWLHDVNLVGLMLEWAERLHFEGRMGWRGDRRDDTVAGILGAELQARYGDAYRADLFADAPPYDDAITRGPLFAVSAVHAARAVIVHSAHARELLLRDLALSGAEAPPITVVPHAFPSVTPRDPGDRNPDPTVVSFGFCAARKAPELLVEAMAGLSAPARLVFAGSCTDESREHIQETADALGIADRVHITGYLPEADYQAWLRRAWCAVQLRRVDFGESTGTVHDAMAAGLPVVTNIASCRELPPGAIVAVDLDPDALATHLDRVLFDEPTASELSRRAQAHAASWTFTDVAGRLRELIVETVPKGSRPFVRAR